MRVAGLCTVLLFVFAFTVGTPADRANAEISYDQILERPDDLTLNLAFARQESAAGRLEQAAGALERLLLLEPDWDEVRLYYAIVLYRLNDLVGANRELDLLAGRDLPPAMAGEVARYASLVSADAKNTRITGSVGLGTAFDSNPLLASEFATGLVNDVPTDLSSPNADGSFVATVNGRLEHSLGVGNGDFLFLRGHGWFNEQFSAEEADYINGLFSGGASFFFGDLQLTPFGEATVTELANEPYRYQYGAGIAAEYVVSPMLTITGRFKGLYQDYEQTSYSTVGSQRDGWYLLAGGGFSARLSDRTRIGAEGRYVDKSAKVAGLAYDGPGVYAHAIHSLGKGQYILGQFWYWHYTYDAPDPRYSSTITRKDNQYRGKVSYGIPLGTVAEFAGGDVVDEIASITMQVSGEYFYQDSNIPNIESENWQGDVLFIKKFRF